MRIQSLFLVLFLVPLLSVPGLVAQTKEDSSSGSQYKWPNVIAGRNVSLWVKDLKHPDPGVRARAIQTLPSFGPSASEAVPDLVDLLSKDSDVSPRVNAAIALGMLEIRDFDLKNVVNGLARRLTQDPQSIVRYHSAVTLRRFDADAKEAVPMLITATRDRGSWEIRQAAISTLGKVGTDKVEGPDPQATQALLVAIRDYCARVRLEAVMALGSMGKPTVETTKTAVIRALQATTRDRDSAVAIWSYVGLMALDQVSEEGLKTISKFLKKEDVDARVDAARALGVMGAEAKSHIPELLEAFQDKDLSVVSTACWAVGEIGRKVDPGEKATSALTTLSQDKMTSADIKQVALVALEKIKGKKTDTTAPPTPMKPKVEGNKR